MPALDLRRRHLRLALPIALSNLTVPVTGLVDAGMLGHLAEIRHLAGVALASVLFDYLYWGFGFLRMSTVGLVAQAEGRGDGRESLRVLVRGVALAGAIGAALLLARGPLAAAGFALLAGDAAVEHSGRAYYAARILGAPAALANFAFLGFFIGRQQGGRALVMTGLGNAANVLLDYVFIYRMGMAAGGAGLATALSQGLMLAVAVALLARDRLAWRGVAAGLRDGTALRALLALNRDIGIRTLCLITAFALFVNLSALHGPVVLAANALLLKLLDLAAYGIDGLAFATESLAGVLKGARDRAGLAELLRISLWRGELLAGAFVGSVLVAGAPLLGALTSHADVVAAALALRGWWALALLFGAAAYVYDGFFIGLTEGAALRNAMLVSLGLGFAPLAAAAFALHSLGLLWAAFALFMGARAVTLAARRERVLSAL